MTTSIRGTYPERSVWVGDTQIKPFYSQSVINHSPDGFNWGYGGSGAAQLALAILLEVTDRETALKLYYDFKWEYVATWEKGQDFEAEIDFEKWIHDRLTPKIDKNA